MKILVNFLVLFLLLGTVSCSTNSSGSAYAQLDANSFNEKWSKNKSNAILLDVRTPEEFKSGHIVGAKNIDFNSNDFQEKLNELDKTKIFFVYCLSGGRSSSTMSLMKSIGFTNVIELDGGMMSWRAAGLLEEKGIVQKPNSDFTFLISKNEFVLVDFYAEWCAPCKKMKPVIDELSHEKIIKVITLNADVEQKLVSQFKVENLPTLVLIKKGIEVWRGQGEHNKKQLIQIINKYK